MTNMSYCRFRNTLQDLLDCKEQLELLLSGDQEVTSIDDREERRARVRLIETCCEVVELFTSSGLDADTADLERSIARMVEESEQAITQEEQL